MTRLIEDVRVLVEAAASAYAGTPAAGRLHAVRTRLDDPLRVAIAGRVKAGKSTLLNALVGEQLAPTDAGECTRIVTWYRHGPTYRVTLDLHDGTSRPARFTRDNGAIEVDLGGLAASHVRRMVVEWPSSRLADLTLIDTPGVASVNADVSQRAADFLTPAADEPAEADAVLYLMRHMHTADLSFLESFHDDELAHASPVNAIGVLSRADEIGVGRQDAMRSAGRIARRYRMDDRLRRLCQTVVPVAGLLAETAATLMEDEYQALQALAAAPRDEAERLLLSADRFVEARTTAGLTPLERRHLLDRFGIFGVRVALPLIRQGVSRTAGDLAGALRTRSGIVELREELLAQFAARRDVLRARSAVLAVESIVTAHPHPDAQPIAREAERLVAGEHAFAEIRLLNAHRRGSIPFAEADLEAVERLLGAGGSSPAAMLDIPEESSDEEVRAALLETIAHWRRQQENPLSSRELVEAATILVRTCEGIVGRMARPVGAVV